MIEYIVLSIVIFTFLIASIEDIKKREVYDYINYSLVFIVLIISIFDSIFINSFDPVKYVGFGLLIGFLFGSILFYSGVWGGGDAKFLIGFSASSYYLMKFVNVGTEFNDVYYRIVELINTGFIMFLNFFLEYIIFFDILFLCMIFVMIFKRRNRKELKNLINLFTILFLLFLGLYFDYSNIILIIYGFFAFLLMFFDEDGEIFASVYFKIKKKIKNLDQGDIIDKSIKFDKEVVVDSNKVSLGLTKEEIIKLKEFDFREKSINVRKILPFSILIGLNYVVYMLKIITLDNVNLTILAFLLKFLFYSFMVGGVLAIFILVYFFIKNIKKVKLAFNLFEKIVIGIVFISSIVFGMFDNRFFLFLGFIFILLFIKLARNVEGMIFIKEKNIKDVVPGDWVVQDIRAGDKLIYSIDDFKLGIDEIQIKRIEDLSRNHKKLKNILVKDGLAFLPPLFVGFLILILL